MKTIRPSSSSPSRRKSPLLTALFLGGLLAAATAPARAEQEAVADRAAPSTPSFALTFAPLLLYSSDEDESASMLELTGELRLARKLSVALVAGAGRIKQERTIITPEQSGLRYDVGVQARYYLLGDFRHGMQLGAELIYAVDSYDDPSWSVRFSQPAVFAGYKFTSAAGFTVDAQLGVRRIAETMVAGGNHVERDARVLPLLNLNLGWSF